MGAPVCARAPVLDSSGFLRLAESIPKWEPEASLESVRTIWLGAAQRAVDQIDRRLAGAGESPAARVALSLDKVALLHSAGDVAKAYRVLEELRSTVERDPDLVQAALGTVIYYQGLTAMRLGENENCVMCRGESSCILPISPAAVHTNPAGSRLAIKHYTEYLVEYPDDLEVRWLLNVAHMTLGEYPDNVDSRFRLDFDRFFRPELDIGKFRDVGHRVGVNRFNQSGGAIMEDFDNDGLLDLVVTTLDPAQHMAYYRNKGDGTFRRSVSSGGGHRSTGRTRLLSGRLR